MAQPANRRLITEARHTWDLLAQKPTSYPPAQHEHALDDVTGLQDALDGKTDTTDPRLSDARTPTMHTHEITDVDGLQAIIDRAAYDSGRRAIWEELVNGWVATSSVYIQRTGNTVHLLLNSSSEGLDGADSTDSRFWEVPVGFRPRLGNYGHVGWASTPSPATPVSIFKSTNYLASSHRGLVQGIVSWPTADPIPTTLPGDPS